MKKTAFFLALLFSISLVAAVQEQVTVFQPTATSISSGGLLDLGVIGPGQKVEIIADFKAGVASKLNSKEIADWDRFEVIEDSLPIDWTKKDGLIYESTFSAFVTAAEDAEDGTYFFNMQVIDEYEGAEKVVFRVKVRISRDVLELSAEPSSVLVGVGNPALFTLKLKNKSRAADAFTVTISGLPAAWEHEEKVYVSHDAERIIVFEVGASEQGEYSIEFKATSLSSEEITATASSQMVAEISLWQDILAATNGIMLFPSAEQAIVSILGFAARIFG